MKKILILLITALNIITAGITITHKVENIGATDKITQSINIKPETKNITASYKKHLDGSIVVEFSDNSWAIIDDEKSEYVFQPACMGDWDMTFNSYQDLTMAMATYFQDDNVEIKEPKKINQSKENKSLNPQQYEVIENELNKLPEKIKRLLVNNEVEITTQNDILDSIEGVETYGLYYWDSNHIYIDAHDYSVEYALLHEIGHALDDIIDMRTEKIISSYEKKEIEYDNEHFYSDIAEYIAQGVHEYFNGTLDKNTDMYKELNKILGEYK